MVKQLGKKGQIGDYVVMTVFITIFLFVSVITYMLVTNYQQAVTDKPEFAGAPKEIVDSNQARYATLFDKLIFGAFVLLSIGIIISVVLIDVHPVFFVISLIVYILLAGFMMFQTNMADSFLNAGTISTYAADFPLSTYLYNHLLQIYLIVGAIVMIVLYGKARHGAI